MKTIRVHLRVSKSLYRQLVNFCYSDFCVQHKLKKWYNDHKKEVVQNVTQSWGLYQAVITSAASWDYRKP